MTSLTDMKRQDFLSEIASLAKYSISEEPVGANFPQNRIQAKQLDLD